MHKLQLKKKKKSFNTQDKLLLFSPPHTFTPTPHPPPYFCLSSLTLLTLSLILFSPPFSYFMSHLLSFVFLIPYLIFPSFFFLHVSELSIACALAATQGRFVENLYLVELCCCKMFCTKYFQHFTMLVSIRNTK